MLPSLIANAESVSPAAPSLLRSRDPIPRPHRIHHNRGGALQCRRRIRWISRRRRVDEHGYDHHCAEENARAMLGKPARAEERRRIRADG
jgi:hypothetical protein